MRRYIAVLQLYQSWDFLRLFRQGEAQKDTTEKVTTNNPKLSDLKLKRASAKRIDELEARLTSIEAFMKNQKLLPKNDHAETRRSNGKGKAGQKSASTGGYKGTTEAADTLEFESNELTPTSMCDKSSCAGASPATVGCFGSLISSPLKPWKHDG